MTFKKRLRQLQAIVAHSSGDLPPEKVEYPALEDNESSFESLSADGDGGKFSSSDKAVSTSLNPVQLPRARLSEYSNALFPKNKAFLSEAVQELVTISGRINALFAFYRFCLYNGRTIASMDPASVPGYLNEHASQILDSTLHGQAFDTKGPQKSTFQSMFERFLDNTASGFMHVIQPSVRYPGGYDFRFVGSPSSRAGDSPTINVRNGSYSVQSFSSVGLEDDTVYQREYVESYATEFSQKVVAAGFEVMDLLFPNQNVSDATSSLDRKVVMVPFGFDFTSIDDIFFKHTGIVIQTAFLRNIDASVVSNLQEFFSPIIIRTPEGSLVSKAERSVEALADGQRSTFDPTSYMSREGLSLMQSVSFSLALTLPKDIAEYVSQAEEGEHVSLLSLHNWVNIWARQYFKKPRAAAEGGRLKRTNMPRYVLPVSKSLKVTQTRKENNLTLEPGKTDDNNIFIDAKGGLSYLPKQEARSTLKNVYEYESDLESHIQKCSDLGIPINTTSVPREIIAASGSNEVVEEFKTSRQKSVSHAGKLLTYDWDYNLVMTVNVANPSAMTAHNINGSAQPDSLTIGDYLGLNFAGDGEPPMRKSFADSMLLMLNALPEDGGSSDIMGTSVEPDLMLSRFGALQKLISFYQYMAVSGRVPGATELVKIAAGELGLSTLAEDDKSQDKMYGIYIDAEQLRPMQAFSDGDSDKQAVDRFITAVLRATLIECGGNRSSYIRQQVAAGMSSTDPVALEEEVQEHPSYFDPSTSPASDFGRLYNYLGGQIFRVAMEKLSSLPPEVLFNSEPPIKIKQLDPVTGSIKETDEYKASFSEVSTAIMPLAVMFSKYIPNSEVYLAEAAKQVESNTRDDSITSDDIRVAAAQEGGQLFPHQVQAHQSLRGHPKFAILDVAPGGGKTSISLTDIGALVQEMSETDNAQQIKPMILCPDGLIKNWVDDMTIFTKDKWNMIPINRDVMSRWGPEKLAELIEDAPSNTILVAGFNFMRGNSFKVVIGTHTVNISGNLEFIKRFGFDYIAIDESHKLKTKTSARHQVIKQLTTASYIRYLRILSGTIIADRVKDIVGQTALSNSHIFRDSEFAGNLDVNEAIAKRRDLELNGEVIPSWEVDTPQRARQKLSQYAAVITLKKKEWAFMLPSPIETFHAVPLEPNEGEGVTADDVELGAMHQRLYDAVLKESIEEIEDLVKKAKSRKARMDDDDDDDDEDDDLELGEDDELGGISSNDLKPYLQRIERLVTNPMADPLAPEIFGAAGVTHYVSRKAKYISNIIDKHFHPEEWSKDKIYREYSLVSHSGNLYFARKFDNTSHMRNALPDSTRGVSPSEDTDTWKLEPEGKVIVFCRYTNSVNGIYDALPDRYKSMAVKFTGEEEDKWSNLDAFINDKNTKILIANEMGISEGHNLQLASRIIRVESPWGPGELDQSSSRIFRPDPKAAKAAIENGKPGELYRDVIFLDWVLADNTMEVAKQARLIAKIFNKARFDEAENGKKFNVTIDGNLQERSYADILDQYHVEEISMSLDTLRSRASLQDPEIREYTLAYAQLNDLMRQEFHEMRVTQDHTMKDLPAQDSLPGFRKVLTPFVAGQKPPVIDGERLSSLKQFVRQEGNEEYLKNPNLLVGKPIVTDLGKGQIVKVNVRYTKRVVYNEDGTPMLRKGKKVTEFAVDEYGNRVVDADNPISSFVIKTAHDNVISSNFSDTGLGFIPIDIDNAKFESEYKVDTLSITKRDLQAEDNARKSRDAKERKAAIRADARANKERKEAKARAKAAADAQKRKKNIAQGKPINAGIRSQKEVPSKNIGNITKSDAEEADMRITLHPASYHGFLVLEASASDPDAVNLEKFKFKMSGPYVYCTSDRYARFSKVLDYIEDNFVLSDASAQRLFDIQDAFEEDKKAIYRANLAPVTALPYFFATRKRMVTNRKEIRPFPIVMPNELMIAVDLKTNPAIKRHIGKTIPGAVTKWIKSEGDALYFSRNKSDLKAKVKQLRAAGYTIENFEELKREIANIKFKASSGKKK